MTTRLKLICHPSTAATRRAAFAADEPLDAHGRKTLAGIAERPPHAERYFTSPARRAVETCAILGFEATAEPMLRDCDYGRWTGRTFEDVHAEEPEAVAEWLRDPGANPHGGESTLALMERVANWLDIQMTTSGTVVAVTHASVIRAAIVHAIRAEARSCRHIDIAPLSLTRLSCSGDRWTLSSMGPMPAKVATP